MSVFCVDIDPDACEAARLMMERSHLGDKVQIVLGDGAEFDYAAFQHVFIASLVTKGQSTRANSPHESGRFGRYSHSGGHKATYV